jgi:DNA-binding transcriptional MerR regulator
VTEGDPDSAPSGERPEKSLSAFRTISEVADELGLPQHVLRFWETKFSEITPMKRAGGRRYYRPEDVDFLRRIKQHLHVDGMTIRGVQKLLRDADELPRKSELRPAEAKPTAPKTSGLERDGIARLVADLTVLRDDLRAALDLTTPT